MTQHSNADDLIKTIHDLINANSFNAVEKTNRIFNLVRTDKELFDKHRVLEKVKNKIVNFFKSEVFDNIDSNSKDQEILNEIKQILLEFEKQHVKYLLNEKFNKWTVTYELRDELEIFECEDEDEVIQTLKELQKNEKGIEMRGQVNVFPPSSNLTPEEFFKFVEKKG